jgi:hypothetical protein
MLFLFIDQYNYNQPPLSLRGATCESMLLHRHLLDFGGCFILRGGERDGKSTTEEEVYNLTGCAQEGEVEMELPSIVYLGAGLAMMGGYHLWDKNFRKRRCIICGDTLRSRSKYYCRICFLDRTRMKGVLPNAKGMFDMW